MIKLNSIYTSTQIQHSYKPNNSKREQVDVSVNCGSTPQKISIFITNVPTQQAKGQLQEQQRNTRKIHEITNHKHKHVNNNNNNNNNNNLYTDSGPLWPVKRTSQVK
jgi:acetate kinase